MTTTAPPIIKFDRKMYQAALTYYGLPGDYNRTFQQASGVDKETGETYTYLRACDAAAESSKGSAVWVQVNKPREGGALTQWKKPKKAKNEDIERIANIPLDAEHPPEPAIAHRIGLALATYLVKQGFAEPEIAVEDSGAGFHIALPIPPTEITQENAKQWNEAVSVFVKKYIEPEFLRLCAQEGIQIDLVGYDISRVLSAPGTWRPTNPKKSDCDALKQGYLRRWLSPYIDGNYPIRKECAKLADLIRAEFEQLNTEHKSQSRPGRPLSLSDNDLLEMALNAKNGINFRDLWYGNTSRYTSASEADSALCFMLAFWTGKNPGRMDSLFRRSGLYREEKWDHGARSGETYGEGTINRAIELCTAVYDPYQHTRERIDRVLVELEELFTKIHSRKEETRDNIGQIPQEKQNPALKEVPLDRIYQALEENEYGDARLFAEIFKGQVVYDCSEKSWYFFNGQHWQKDHIGKIRHLVSGYLGAIYIKASADLHMEIDKIIGQIETAASNSLANTEVDALKSKRAQKEGQMKALTERAKALRSAKRCNNVLTTFAQTDTRLAFRSDIWDRDPWLLAVSNGVIDLQTGEFRDGQPHDYIRTVAPTAWEGLDKDCPLFKQTLKEIFQDRKPEECIELIGFLKRLLGYATAGLTVEHIFPILYGEEGRNGKDMLLTILKAVLGPIAGAISNDVFIAADKFRSAGAATPHLVDLQGKRIVWGSETKQGDKLNVAQIKMLTGGGDIPARPLYGQQYTFTPTHTLLLITNYKPHADARDKAFWERAYLVEFNIRFVDTPMQPNERKKKKFLAAEILRSEASGVLAWLVQGCLEWQQQQGLNPPKSVKMATERYRQSEDLIQAFVDECCYAWDETAEIKASELYTAYKTWCKDGNLYVLNSTLFGTEMSKKYKKVHKTKGMHYQGIRLRQDSDPADNPTPPMQGSENPNEPCIDREVSSQADIASFETADYAGYAGLNQEVPLESPKILLTRGLFSKTMHTLHNGHSDNGLNPPIERCEDTMQGLECSTYLALEYPHTMTQFMPPAPDRACYECTTRNWLPYWDLGDRKWGCGTCYPEIAQGLGTIPQEVKQRMGRSSHA